MKIKTPASLELCNLIKAKVHKKYNSGSICSGVASVSKTPQLSGWIRDHNIKEKIHKRKYNTLWVSFNKINTSCPTPSFARCPQDDGSVRCRINMCKITKSKLTIPSIKCKVANLRIPKSESVAEPRSVFMMVLETRGSTDIKFNITIAAQKLILPETKT